MSGHLRSTKKINAVTFETGYVVLTLTTRVSQYSSIMTILS